MIRRKAIATLVTGVISALGVRPALAQDWIVQAIYNAAAAHGVSGDWLLSVAQCESGLNPYVVNARGDTGLFQFQPSTFYAYGGSDLFSVTDQANVAAYMFSIGLSCHWACVAGPGLCG